MFAADRFKRYGAFFKSIDTYRRDQYNSYKIFLALTLLRNKIALRTKLRNLNLKSKLSTFDSFREISVHMDDFLKFVGVAKIFLRLIDLLKRTNNFW